MITPDYCRVMARYNVWQNGQIGAAMARLDDTELRRDRGAFFGSIIATANHLLWGDLVWMSRFDSGEPPLGAIAQSVGQTPTLAAWAAERARVDAWITKWAARLGSADLRGDLSWYSGAAERDITKPRALLIAHMFNHQTHHRGQIHAMLTAAGQRPGDTDLPFMPEE